MESDSDLPLIEIAGEDDSLLQSSPHGAVSITTATDGAYFFCSPLQPLRSKPQEGFKSIVESQKPSSTFCGDKENVNANKIEENKFSLPPQKMKRKKKGFNLRKSLAWDRAFFEEEGVLNSEELSMITGSGPLSVIHEETNCISDSPNLNLLEENLFKATPGSTLKKYKTVGGSPVSKQTSPARDSTVQGSGGKWKVLSARDTNRSGSKRSGFPRPMASSSLKKPANANTIMSATKEPKVSKLPVPKSVPCAISRSSKNVTVGASDLRRNQIASSMDLNTKSRVHNAKVGPSGRSLTGKCSTHPARRNVASLVKSSPTKTLGPPITEANNGLDATSKQALPTTFHTSYMRNDRSRITGVPQVVTSKQALPSASHASYSRDEKSRKNTGVNLLHTQLPSSKPSGLRMPSPSLGFFDQIKASSLPGPAKRSSQQCRLPNLRPLGSVNSTPELRQPSSIRKLENGFSDGAVMQNINIEGSSSGSVSSSVTDKVELVSQVRPSYSEGHGMGKDQQKLNSFPVPEDALSMARAEPNIVEEISYIEDVDFPNNDKFLMEQESSLVIPPKSMETLSHSWVKVADETPLAQKSDTVSNSICEVEAKDDSSTFEMMSRKMHVEDAPLLALDGKPEESCCHGDDKICCQQDTSMVQINFSSDKTNFIAETNEMSCEIDVNKHNAQVAKQNMPSVEARILNWNPEAHGLSFEDSNSMEKCCTSWNNEDISSKVKGCGSGSQSLPDLLKHDVIKESVPGSPQDESPVASCMYSMDVKNAYELSGCPELQLPNIETTQVSQEFRSRTHFSGTLPTISASCNDYEETVNELVVGNHNARGSNPLHSNTSPGVAPVICDGRPDSTKLDLAVTKPFVVEQSSQDLEGYTTSCDDRRLCNQAAYVDSNSSANMANGENSDYTFSRGSILQDSEDTVSSSNSFAEDAEIIVVKSNYTPEGEQQQRLDDTMYSPVDKDATKELEKSGIGRKQDGLVIKPPLGAVPFSDEWLAAIEAAGEEILTKKGGAVQNSPPNKSPPQLGPYSPVKRKQNQVIGPFDCTKVLKHINDAPGSQ